MDTKFWNYFFNQEVKLHNNYSIPETETNIILYVIF